MCWSSGVYGPHPAPQGPAGIWRKSKGCGLGVKQLLTLALMSMLSVAMQTSVKQKSALLDDLKWNCSNVLISRWVCSGFFCKATAHLHKNRNGIQKDNSCMFLWEQLGYYLASIDNYHKMRFVCSRKASMLSWLCQNKACLGTTALERGKALNCSLVLLQCSWRIREKHDLLSSEFSPL